MLLALTACHPKQDDSVETQNFASPQPAVSPKLQSVDSLLWQQPDSALALLLPWFDTCCTDVACNVSTTYNHHYAHLLLAELLYKNDYAQTNRAELRQAVAFFDSLVRQAPPLKGGRGDSRHVLDQNGNFAFLTARAHYINGVGYYEQDSVVQACKEYLKALEIMESHFEEKELVGEKARFMAYTYNRLGEMFSAQFMMEPAITCCEQSLVYSRIAPTSSFGIANTLYRLGMQYDKLGQQEKAMKYYKQALEALPVLEGPLYRDIITNKSLCDYQLGLGSEQPLDALRQVLAQAMGDDEISARNVVIGSIFFEEGLYDSALVYLEPVFEQKENTTRKIRAADFMRIVYDSLGQEDNAEKCMQFLANHKKMESENKALVSQLEGLFQSYLNQKQEKESAQDKMEAVRRVVRTMVPIALAAVSVIVLAVMKRGKRYLKAEQQVHRMEQAALSGRLKRSNQELRELKDRIHLYEDSVPRPGTQAVSFVEEPIYRLVMERVNEGQFKAKIDCGIYKEYALDKQQLLDLRLAVDRHFNQLTLRLRKAYPKLTQIDIDYCCLYLLNLTHADVSALMQRAYNTVVERDSKIKKVFGSEKPLPVILMDIAMNPSYN